MRGIRVYPDEKGWLDNEAMSQPGAYGRATAVPADKRAGWWQVTTPDGRMGCLDPSVHTVTEHEDGTITVMPSIDMSKRIPGGYHGYLRQGRWYEC